MWDVITSNKAFQIAIGHIGHTPWQIQPLYKKNAGSELCFAHCMGGKGEVRIFTSAFKLPWPRKQRNLRNRAR